MQRTLGTILIVVMVVLAGCNGVLGGGSNEPVETFTPVPVPTDKPTPTPVPQLAPGLTGEGIENPSALVAAHTSFLGNHSFTVRMNSTWMAPNDSAILDSVTIFHVGPPGEGFHSVPVKSDSNGHRYFEASPVYTEVWSSGERVLIKQTYANGTTTYDRPPITAEEFRGFLVNGNLHLLRFFVNFNTAVTERFTQNGTTRYHVRGTTQTDQWGNVSLQLLVDSRGVIHEVRTVRERTFFDNSTTIIRETRFSKIGTTDAPERPSWVDKALNRTTLMQLFGTTMK